MVWIAQARAQPRSCALPPAPAHPAGAYWEEAQAAQLARPTLPVVNLPQPTPPLPPRSQEGWAAALPLPRSDAGSEWAQQAAFVPLASLRGPADSLRCGPQAVQLQPATPEPALPPFLLPRLRTPRIDEWHRRSTALADQPCVPIAKAGPAAAAGQGGLAVAIAQECSLQQETAPELPQVEREDYRFQPQPVQLASPSTAGTAAKPFSLLDRLLQQGPQGLLVAAEPLLLDVQLPRGGRAEPDAAAPSSLLRELEQLAADGDSSEAAAAAAAGFVGLKSLGPQPELQADNNSGSVGHAGALLQSLAAAPKPVQLEAPLPAAALPSFLLPPLAEPNAAPVDPAASSAARTAAGSRPHQFFLLEPPVLPAAAAVRGTALVFGAPTSAFAQLFQPVPVPPAPAAASTRCLVPEGCQPVSLATLVAQDMILDDGGGLMLPPVQVEEPGEADSPAPALLPLIQSECGCKPANTAHLALHLNWSLSGKQAAMRPPELTAAVRSMRQQLLPRLAPTLPPTELQQQEQERQARLIRQLLVPFNLPGKQGPAWSGLQPAAAVRLQPGDLQAVPIQAPTQQQRRQQQQQQQQQQEGAAPAPGCPADVPGQPLAKRAKHGGAADMQYFLQLQHGGAGASGTPTNGPASSSSSGEASAEEAVAAHLKQPSTAVHSVELPAVHTQLLRLLRQDEQRLVAAAPAPGVPAEVARSDFLSLDALHHALQAAAGQPGSRGLLRLYATMAVIRQTAAMLVHHGVRCAHLYLAQSQSELPGLLNAVTAAQELRAANRQVDAGQLEDSPKMAALQRLLAGIAALAPGSKCCVVGHPKSFFTLYKPVLAAGQTVSQLDRSGALATQLAAAKDASGRAAFGEQLAAAVQQSCASASCVLVPAGLVASGCFPLAAFQQLVVYASEPTTQAGLRPHLSQLTCPLHFLEVPVPSLDPAVQQKGAPAAAAAAAAAGPTTGATAGQAAPAAPPGVARVQHAARTVAPEAAQVAAAPAQDWPLIISSDPCRPIRSSRPLYEAVLALEQQGAAVVERPLSLVDLVLSPSAGLVICDNSAAKLEFEDFMAVLAPVLSRLSFAFARVVLVCEGSPGFQAQVLCGTERLLALGRRVGLHLQCHATTSAAGTAAVVASVARAWLTRWQAGGPGLQYAVAEEPTEEEAFLTRFYSLNPHSACLLLSLGLPLAHLLRLGELNPLQVPKALSLLPRHSLDLFCKCAAYGQPTLGIPTASVMHPAQQQQQQQQPQAYGTPSRPNHQPPVEQADSCVPAWEQQQAWGCQQQAWEQQLQQQQQAAAVAAASAAAPGWGGRAQADMAAAGCGHVYLAQQAGPQGGFGVYATAAQQQAPRAEYLAAQLEGQQQRQWDSRSEPHAQMNEAVYQRGMQLMQARLRGAILPQPAAPAPPPPQQHPYGSVAQARAADYDQQYHQAAMQQQQALDRQQMLQYQQQEHERQLLLQQQAEAAAFPDLPGLEEAAAGMEPSGYPGVQQWQQAREPVGQYGAGRLGGHALLPLHGGIPAGGTAPGSAAYGTAAQPYMQAGYEGRWPAGKQGGAGHFQAQQAGVDEFGVSMQPSMSDDESDNAAVHQQQAAARHAAAQHAQQPGRASALQQMQQLLVPGRSGSAGVEGGQMGAFLAGRKRDFSVPRSAGKPLAPAAAHRGAGQVTLADAEGSFEEEEGAPAAKRQRGTGSTGQVNNLLRPPAGRGGGSAAGGHKRGGGGGGRWGGGRRNGGRWGGGRSFNKPSRAW